MRVALLYPPPWKLARPGEPAPALGGPPGDYREGDLDADFHQTPYGLFALGAAALRAGHAVKVLNLSAYAWSDVLDVLTRLDADLYGMSCWTANRRGVAYVAEALKSLRPDVPVVIGGPHATPLASELLARHPDIDLVATGEADETFLEICEQRAAGRPLTGIAGTVFRSQGRVVTGPPRASIADLDGLACPHRHFDTHILMTSRGCAWACTFCGAETTWGRGFRAQSVAYVVDAIESALSRLPVRMIQIKDDTFTTNKKRVLALCREIRARGLQFFWSCDTRVDVLNDELLREMRLAGCQRLSLGVESGSQRILDAIDKKITVDEIAESTRIAKKYGVRVRYYMMLGNRGETAETFRETLAFLDRTRPHEYVFSCLSIFPGTRDYHAAVDAGWLGPSVYFDGDFQELKTPFDASDADTALLNDWFSRHSGLREMHRDGVAECREILAALGDHHAAHLDLGAALYHAGDYAGAERHVRRALELGYPAPGLAHNHLACIAHARGDLDGMMDEFSTGARVDPQHHVLIQNVQRARAWFKARGFERGVPLELVVAHDFRLLERTAQPTLPGPLAEDFARWDLPERAAPEAAAPLRSPDVEGSQRALGPKHRLPMA